MTEYDNNMVAALLRERESYVARGLTDRVQQVDKQLAGHGYVQPVAEPVKPTARRQQTRSK